MSRYKVDVTSSFKKDFKRCAKRGLDMEAIKEAMRLLAENGSLPEEYRPHKLSGNHRGEWECHINGRNSDWIMLWSQNDLELTLLMLRTGTHSDLFG